MLELFGHKSDYAVSADETLMYLQKNPQTDIVLLDIDLGAGLSGEELLPVIREKFKYVQVIMFTSQNSLEMGVECIKKGAFDYMTKPFREKKFLKKVPLALERKKIAKLNDLYMGILVHDLNNPIHTFSAPLNTSGLPHGEFSMKNRRTSLRPPKKASPRSGPW